MVSTASWTKFWRLSLLFTQRNVVYRFIHDKIPTRSLLFRLFPNSYLFCSAPESKSHFLFNCPSKLIFWGLLIREFLWPGTTTDLICSCIRCLSFTSLSVLPTCSAKADVLIIVALSELWKAHWKSTFGNIPFSPTAVLSNTIFALERRKAENEVHRA